jgi:hypothetical protein
VVDTGAVPASMGALGAEGPSTPPAMALRGPGVVERVSHLDPHASSFVCVRSAHGNC